ncbi:hypothetical protein [Pseudomonas phage BL1]|nr:hypothetical protein [Pseudomonas phage BL1]
MQMDWIRPPSGGLFFGTENINLACERVRFGSYVGIRVARRWCILGS